MLLFAGFVVVGLLTPVEWNRLAPKHYVSPLGLVAGAMIIFRLTGRAIRLVQKSENDAA